MSEHRSVSQLNSYERCPYSYYLARIKKVWQRPAAWLAQGTAFHEAAEVLVKSQVAGEPLTLKQTKLVYTSAYQETINRQLEDTPNMQYWFRSGPYAGEVDIVRRYQLGLDQLDRFAAWQESHPEEVVWIAPDGTPGVEIGFDIDLDGVKVRGFIDAVIRHSDGIVVRDYKTGNTPGDDFQLGVYALALAEDHGIEQPAIGEYWMGRTGKPTYPYDLTDWTREAVSEKFQVLDENIRAERFEPKPEAKKCAFCDVASSCEFAAG